MAYTGGFSEEVLIKIRERAESNKGIAYVPYTTAHNVLEELSAYLGDCGSEYIEQTSLDFLVYNFLTDFSLFVSYSMLIRTMATEANLDAFIDFYTQLTYDLSLMDDTVWIQLHPGVKALAKLLLVDLFIESYMDHRLKSFVPEDGTYNKLKRKVEASSKSNIFLACQHQWYVDAVTADAFGESMYSKATESME